MKLEQLRLYALSLPDATEEPHFDNSSFRVKGKIFATVPPGGAFVHVFLDDQQQDMAVALYPEAAEPLMWGKKTVGVRVLLAKAKADFVRELIFGAWARKAPTSLVKAT